MGKPVRIQLSRKKGWRMPPDTVKVDRTTRWGNPFIVGTDGSQVKCVYWLILLNAGYQMISCSGACCDRQRAYLKAMMRERDAGYAALRGKNLACWCALDKPCHADVLLHLVNKPAKQKVGFDMKGYLAGHGWSIENGEAVRLARLPSGEGR